MYNNITSRATWRHTRSFVARVLTVDAEHEAGQALVNELKNQRRVDALERL